MERWFYRNSMTKEEVLTLIDRKIKKYKDLNFVSFTDNDEYYYGVIKGLESAKEIISMLDT